MADSQATTVVSLQDDGDRTPEPTTVEDDEVHSTTLLLADWPPVYVLPTHMSEDEVHEFEDILVAAEATLVHDATRARIVLSAVSTARRAKFELQARGLRFRAPVSGDGNTAGASDAQTTMPATKRRKNNEGVSIDSGSPSHDATPQLRVQVIRSDWLHDCLTNSKALDVQKYLVYEAEIDSMAPARPLIGSNTATTRPNLIKAPSNVSNASQRQFEHRGSREGRRDRTAVAAANEFSGRSFTHSSQPSGALKRRLLPESTTEHDEAIAIPDMPEWVRQNRIYSCERAAPLDPANGAFVELLKKIRLARTLVADEIGVRAYSTSIASIISYPYLLSSTTEVMMLPGCEQKVALLLQEFLETGHVKAADEVDQDPTLSVLNSFYNIWGVGATTAREFYYERHWRDHDDIIEYGWSSLNRHQQIGLKYYDEFEQKMTRSEVEYIASIVTYHAKRIVDEDVVCVIAGGYRRGKKESGDVDLILSHPDESKTKYLISPLVTALEKSGWITHTLIMSEANSARDQETLPLKSLEGRKSGFDTLDKALAVWQDPSWSTKDEDLAENPLAKNPNVHRRVDIIISPWKTVGCAIAGWTSGTTFQRDLRRYSRKLKGWKFDSSGVRDVGTGRWVDLEQWTNKETRAKNWMDAERRVFEGLGLPWREPENRNTG